MLYSDDEFDTEDEEGLELSNGMSDPDGDDEDEDDYDDE
jgi:hypothetical protein